MILVIDDELEITEGLSELLVGHDYDVATAFNGEEGLHQLEKISPDLIILDINMPKMGGIAFYHELASRGGGRPKFPILVLTARASVAQLFRDLEVEGFMTKPFQMEELLEEISLILSKRYGPTLKIPANPKPQNGLCYKILIVENDIHVAAKIIARFSEAGYSTSVVRSATEAIEFARQDQPDLVMTKIKLSDLAGDVLATKLSHMARTEHIPIVLYSDSTETRLDHNVTFHLGEKVGRGHLIESNDAGTLLKTVNIILKTPQR